MRALLVLFLLGWHFQGTASTAVPKAAKSACQKLFVQSFQVANSTSSLISQYRKAVDAIVKTEVPLQGQWSSETGGCVDLSLQLWEALTRSRLSQHLEIMKGQHWFIVDRSFAQQVIIVDPTWRQYFEPSLTLDMPEIFVGNSSQLITMMQELLRRGTIQFREQIQDENALRAKFGSSSEKRMRDFIRSVYQIEP